MSDPYVYAGTNSALLAGRHPAVSQNEGPLA
jgi:hypothetical protein